MTTRKQFDLMRPRRGPVVSGSTRVRPHRGERLPLAGLARPAEPVWRGLALVVLTASAWLYSDHVWTQTTVAQALPDGSTVVDASASDDAGDDAGGSGTPVDTDFESKGGMQGECSIRPAYGAHVATPAERCWWWVAMGGSVGALCTRRAWRSRPSSDSGADPGADPSSDRGANRRLGHRIVGRIVGRW